MSFLILEFDECEYWQLCLKGCIFFIFEPKLRFFVSSMHLF